MNVIKYLELSVEPRVVEYFMDELGEYQALNGVSNEKQVNACVKLYNLMSQNRNTKFNIKNIHPSLGLFLDKHKVEIKYILAAIKETIKLDVKRCNTNPDDVDEREMTMILCGMNMLHEIFLGEDKAMKVFLN